MSYAVHLLRIYFEKIPQTELLRSINAMDLRERKDGTLGILQSSENNVTGANCCCSPFTNIICSNSAEATRYGTTKLKKSVEKCAVNYIILSWAVRFTEGHYVILD